MFKHFNWSLPLHVCMHAACLVAFFSFLRIFNLMPYSLADLQSKWAYFLTRNDVSFTSSGAILRVYRTKTIQFSQCVLEILLPFIAKSLLSYFRTVPAPANSPLFVINQHGIKPILAWHFNKFLKSYKCKFLRFASLQSFFS